MGMTANQLLSKALSTDSEDEAIACLKMARKKGLKLEVDFSKDQSLMITVLKSEVQDNLRLNNKQRIEINYLEGRLRTTRLRMYNLEVYLIVTAAAIAAELIVIIILANGGMK